MNKRQGRHPVNHLRAWRLSRFLTQADLADKAGISKSSVTRIEINGGDVNVGTIRLLAMALGIEPGDLVAGPPPENAKTPEAK